jgi:hypothetical protein
MFGGIEKPPSMGQVCASLLILWALLLRIRTTECSSVLSPVLNVDLSHPVVIQALNDSEYFGFSVALSQSENNSW